MPLEGFASWACDGIFPPVNFSLPPALGSPRVSGSWFFVFCA